MSSISTSGYKTNIALNRAQNEPDFEIDPDKLPIIFKKGLFSKTLEPPSKDPTAPRLVTVKCFYKGCSKVFRGQRVNHTIINYITHYKYNHRAFNIQRVLISLEEDSRSSSSQATITQAFRSLRGTKRPASPIKEPFSSKKYKSLLIRFIIENNLSFRSISSTSFKELTLYLKKQSPLLYNKILHEYLKSIYKERKEIIQGELDLNIKEKGYFSLNLDAWTAINQDSYYINSSLKLKSYAISIAYLSEPHSGKYMFQVLSKALEDWKIQDNIISRLITYSITRDNASSNDTLIEAFIKDYDIKGIKFQGDITCLAHVLNLVVQDILKNIIKDAYSELDDRDDISNIENNREGDLHNNTSLWKKIRTIILGLKYSKENNRALKRHIEALEIQNPCFPQLVPEVYKIYTRLETIRDEFNIEPFTSAINKGIGKLRKYYPKSGITEYNKALYTGLVLDPRIKVDGLSLLGLSNGIISDIKRKLQEEYNL
ncbi:uncharacterized protein RCO7_08132 [Rhynchosporium graminicola]|uniref:HAT C-terminal dimerisation domain-containing protein n=1 Tax=Rhynchosporium graminicola TaxID=2792576 RepID=A0A1E1LDN4_9HELO|nr:uncharacterized protein RCO7_08132 [Rhynchosporium commune]